MEEEISFLCEVKGQGYSTPEKTSIKTTSEKVTKSAQVTNEGATVNTWASFTMVLKRTYPLTIYIWTKGTDNSACQTLVSGIQLDEIINYRLSFVHLLYSKIVHEDVIRK